MLSGAARLTEAVEAAVEGAIGIVGGRRRESTAVEVVPRLKQRLERLA